MSTTSRLCAAWTIFALLLPSSGFAYSIGAGAVVLLDGGDGCAPDISEARLTATHTASVWNISKVLDWEQCGTLTVEGDAFRTLQGGCGSLPIRRGACASIFRLPKGRVGQDLACTSANRTATACNKLHWAQTEATYGGVSCGGLEISERAQRVVTPCRQVGCEACEGGCS